MNLQTTTRRERFCLRWLEAGLTLFVTSFLWSPSRDGLDVVFHLFFFIPLVLVLPWRRATLKACGGIYTATALAYAAFSVVSSLWSGSPAGSDVGFFLWQWFVLAAWLCGACWLFTQRTPDLRRLYKTLIITGLVIGCSLVWVFYASNPLGTRLIGWSVVRNEVVVAQTFGAIALLAYVLSLQATTTRISLAYLLATALLMVPVALSQSRWPVLAFVVMAFIALLMVRPKVSMLMVHVTVYLIVAVGTLLVVDVNQFLIARGLSYRDLIWSEVWQMALKQPWFGSGYVKDDHLLLSIGEFHHPHNAWLDIFYRTGLVGLTLSLLHLATVAVSFSKHRELLPLYLWLAFGCICQITDSRVLFWELNAKWFIYWIPAGLIAAQVMAARRQNASKVSPG